MHTHTQLDFAWDNSGEPIPEKTFTHSHLSWSSIISCLLPPSITIHGILSVQFTCLTVFFHNLSPKFSLVYLLAWHPPLHTPYIFSPNHCLLFAAHAHTITTCFAVLPKLCHLILVSLSTLYLELYLILRVAKSVIIVTTASVCHVVMEMTKTTCLRKFLANSCLGS